MYWVFRHRQQAWSKVRRTWGAGRSAIVTKLVRALGKEGFSDYVKWRAYCMQAEFGAYEREEFVNYLAGHEDKGEDQRALEKWATLLGGVRIKKRG